MRYVHLIRSGGDPDTERHRIRHGLRNYRERDVYAIECTSEIEWAGRILDLLADGVPRTFNRIAVELADVGSATAFGTNIDQALWALVDCGTIQHTYAAPIFFTRAGELDANVHRRVS